MNTWHGLGIVAGKALLGAGLVVGSLLHPAIGHAYPVDHGTAAADDAVPGPVPTIDLTSIDDIDVLPTCTLEDCSDVPEQTGLWLDADTGDWYLERGVNTWLIVDDTVTGLAHGANAFDSGYVGGYN